MYYTASSVKRALDAKKNLSAKNHSRIGCPKQKLKQIEFLECYDNPKKCELAQKHKCKRSLHIDSMDKGRAALAVLFFNFTISETNFDGFIDS